MAKAGMRTEQNVIKNKNKLLQDIADGLKANERYALSNLEVAFFVGKTAYTLTVGHAIDFIVNDVYWDERGNWSKADRAEVRVY